jgi:alpha-glucosidase
MLLLTLRGSPTCYYGDEIGMLDAEIPPGMEQDPQSEDDPDHSRDPERSPMQWDSSPNAGFCPEDAEPWLPISGGPNVEAQREDPGSMLSLFRRLLDLRRETPALSVGSYRSLDPSNDSVLAYVREHEGRRMLVAPGFGRENETLDLSEGPEESAEAEVLCSTLMDRRGLVSLKEIEVRPGEGIVASMP